MVKLITPVYARGICTYVCRYSGNKHLGVGKQEEEERNVIIGICALMGIGLLIAAALCYAYNVSVSGRKQLQGASAGGNSKSKSIVVSAEQKKKATPVAGGGGGGGIDNMMAAMAARGPLEFEVRELEEATSKFARKIGAAGHVRRHERHERRRAALVDGAELEAAEHGAGDELHLDERHLLAEAHPRPRMENRVLERALRPERAGLV